MRTLVRTVASDLKRPIMPTKTPAWVTAMRQGLKGQNGEGWMVRDIRGRIQLTCRFDDGQRSSAVTELPWAGASQAELLTLAARIKPMVAAGKTVKESVALLSSTPTGADGATDWPWVAEAFRKHKLNSGQVSERTWRRNYSRHVNRAVALLTAKPKPTSGAGLLKAMVEIHFPDGKGSGLTDRRTCIQYLAQMLKFAVADCGADQRWLPPTDLKLLIGMRAKKKALTTPIKDDQITRLLEGTTDPRWRTAIGLVACFGLRPVELHLLSVNGQLLHCDYRKRTGQCPEGTPPRDIVGLDPIGQEGLQPTCWRCWPSRGMKHCRGCRGPRAGDAFYLHCNRSEVFAQLKEETASTPRTDGSGDKLVPYSLRHGFALRAHEVYGITPRRAAALMGHSLETHSSTYGAWTDREMVESTLADVQAQVERRRLEALVR